MAAMSCTKDCSTFDLFPWQVQLLVVHLVAQPSPQQRLHYVVHLCSHTARSAASSQPCTVSRAPSQQTLYRQLCGPRSCPCLMHDVVCCPPRPVEWHYKLYRHALPDVGAGFGPEHHQGEGCLSLKASSAAVALCQEALQSCAPHKAFGTKFGAWSAGIPYGPQIGTPGLGQQG